MNTPRPVAPRGAMTAVMSAVRTENLPRLLRVAIVREGRILEERTFTESDAVTIGTREGCQLIIAEPSAPARHQLFTSGRDGFQLRLPDGLRATLAAGGAPRPVEGTAALPLDARGKVVFGATTLLFQVTVAPPLSPRPRLPESVKSGLFRGLDWTVTVVAAFSFLAHFGAIGSLYTDWNDRIVAEQESLVSLVQRLPTVPPTPVDPVTDPDPNVTDTTPNPTPNPTQRPNPGPTNNHARPPTSTPNYAAIGAQLARMEAGMLTTFNGTGPSTRNVIDGSIPTGPLDAMAQNNAAIQNNPSGLRLSGGSGPMIPGQRPDLGQALGPQERNGQPGTASTVAIAAPTTTSAPPLVKTGGPAPDDAQRVLAGARARARACYNAGLGSNADMEGSTSFSLALSGAGSVMSVSVTPSGSLTPAVTACIRNVLQGLSFDGKGQPSSVTGSFRFVNPNKGK